MKNKIGLVLSGGGIRGLAHVGLLQALEEEGIRPDYIAGSSAGALVGALYSMGYNSQEILDAFTEIKVFQSNRLTWRKVGFIDTETFLPNLHRYFPVDDFSVLNIPLYITITDLENARCEYISEGEIVRPLMASAAYPPAMSPLKIGDNYYTDGGIMDNFPIYPIKRKANTLIGSFVSPIDKINYEQDISNSGQLAWRAYCLSYHALSDSKFGKCDYVFVPEDLGHIGIFDTKLIHEAYQKGYEQAKAAMPNIVAAIRAKEEAKIIEMNPEQPNSSWYGKVSGLIKSFYSYSF